LAGKACDRHEAAHALRDLVEAGAVGVGPRLAEAGEGYIDKARVDGAQGLIVEAKPALDVRAIVLDQHVGIGGHLFQDRDALRFLEIERDAAFVAVQVEEIGTVPRTAHGVQLPTRGHLDLDDVGAPVGEVARGRRPGARARQVDHFEPGEGALALGAHRDITLLLAFPAVFHESGAALAAPLAFQHCPSGPSTRRARRRPDWCPGSGSATWSSP
jgi:hypothetical protein